MRERICTDCEQSKPILEFEKDKRKPEGRGYRCKECNQVRVREARRKAKLPDGERTDTFPIMTNELFEMYHSDQALIDYIDKWCSIRCRGDADFYEDLEQEAWMHISKAQAGKDITYYSEIAERAIERCEWKMRVMREHDLCLMETWDRAEYQMWAGGSY